MLPWKCQLKMTQHPPPTIIYVLFVGAGMDQSFSELNSCLSLCVFNFQSFLLWWRINLITQHKKQWAIIIGLEEIKIFYKDAFVLPGVSDYWSNRPQEITLSLGLRNVELEEKTIVVTGQPKDKMIPRRMIYDAIEHLSGGIGPTKHLILTTVHGCTYCTAWEWSFQLGLLRTPLGYTDSGAG